MAEAEDGAKTIGSITVAIAVALIVLICNTIFIPVVWNEVSSTWEQLDRELETVKVIRTAIKDTLDQISVQPTRQIRESIRERLDKKTSPSSEKRRRTILRRRWIHRRKGGKGAAGFGTRNIDKEEVFEIYTGSKMQCKCMSTNTCPRGLPGPAGQKGEDGRPGDPGDVGIKGIDAMDMMVQMVPSGCFVCPVGPNGPKGEDGIIGLPGPVGPSGMPGIPGRNGAPGSPGDIGLPGMPGTRGKPGAAGNPGPDAIVTMSTQGPKGPTGPTGPPGERGGRGRDNYEEGQPGVAGVRGERGLRGTEGKAGERGMQGLPGKPGHKRCGCKQLLRRKEATEADLPQRHGSQPQPPDNLHESHVEGILSQIIKQGSASREEDGESAARNSPKEDITQEKTADAGGTDFERYRSHGGIGDDSDWGLNEAPPSVHEHGFGADHGEESKLDEANKLYIKVPKTQKASIAPAEAFTPKRIFAVLTSPGDTSPSNAGPQSNRMNETNFARSEVSSKLAAGRPPIPHTAPRTNTHSQLPKQRTSRNDSSSEIASQKAGYFAPNGNSLGYRKKPKTSSRHRHSKKRRVIIHPVSTYANTRQQLALARKRKRHQKRTKKAKEEQLFKTMRALESKNANKQVLQNQSTEEFMPTELSSAKKFKDLNVVPTSAHHRSSSHSQMHAAAAYRSTQAKELVPLPFDESTGNEENELKIHLHPAVNGVGNNRDLKSLSNSVEAEEFAEHLQTPKKGRSRMKMSSLGPQTKRKHRKHVKKGNKKLKKIDIPIAPLAAPERIAEEVNRVKTQTSTRNKTPGAANARDLVSQSSKVAGADTHFTSAFEAAEVDGDTSNGEFDLNRHRVLVDSVTDAPLAARFATSEELSTPKPRFIEGASSKYQQLPNSETSLESDLHNLAEDAKVLRISTGDLLRQTPRNELLPKLPVIDEDAERKGERRLESSPSSIRQLQRQRRLLQDMRKMEELGR